MNSEYRANLDSRSSGNRNGDTIDGTAVPELWPPLRLASGAKIQSRAGEAEPGLELPLPGSSESKHRNDDLGCDNHYRKVGSTLIYESWLDRLLDRNSEESLEERARQVRREAHDDDDITDRTRAKREATHISLGFTLDKAIKD